MKLDQMILDHVADKKLLSHPFYQAWDMGLLDTETLKTYGKQYYHHVSSFPRYISRTHSLCTDIRNRQVLLSNLSDEERGEKNHPELWLDFVQGLGAAKEEAKREELNPETRKLIDTFFEICSSSYAEGLAALYVYEEQTPAICETKIRGLQKYYGINDADTLRYFTLHHTVDVEHTKESAQLVNALPEADRERAMAAGRKAAEALWGFLDGMEKVRQEQVH